MDKNGFDSYDTYPYDMLAYLQNYGFNFSKNMYEFAVSKMRNRDGKRMQPYTREQYNSMMSRYGLVPDNDNGYNGLYVMSMATADFLGSSIPDEQHLAMFVKDYIDDADAVDGQVFNRFYADCCRKGIVINWHDML